MLCTGRLPASPSEEAAVPVYAREFWNRTGLFLEQGARYELTAAGTWQDGSIVCGPEGWSRWLYLPLKYTRRVKDKPWFALIAEIADAANPDVTGVSPPMTRIYAGQRAGVTVTTDPLKKGGYLFCYGNDSTFTLWKKDLFYRNNRGSLSLTVKRL